MIMSRAHTQEERFSLKSFIHRRLGLYLNGSQVGETSPATPPVPNLQDEWVPRRSEMGVILLASLGMPTKETAQFDAGMWEQDCDVLLSANKAYILKHVGCRGVYEYEQSSAALAKKERKSLVDPKQVFSSQCPHGTWMDPLSLAYSSYQVAATLRLSPAPWAVHASPWVEEISMKSLHPLSILPQWAAYNCEPVPCLYTIWAWT